MQLLKNLDHISLKPMNLKIKLRIRVLINMELIIT